MSSHSKQNRTVGKSTVLACLILWMLMPFNGRAQKAEGTPTTSKVSTKFRISKDAKSPLAVQAKGEPKSMAIQAPKFEVDPYWPQKFPDEWVTGEVGGTCVDAEDHVFIVNRRDLTPRETATAKPAPPVIELDSEGKLVNSWGNSDLVPKRIHGCFVDYEGNVWVGGNEDAIVQKYSHDGSKLLLQIGTRGLFDTSDGTFEGFAMNSSHTLLNRPASVAVDPSNGDVYVADGYGNRRVVVFDRGGRFVRQWGQQGTAAQAEMGVEAVFLRTVHCVVLGNDGLVYVCDRQGDRIQVFDKMGHFRKNIYIKKGTGTRKGSAGSAWGVAFSPDSAQKYLYVCDGDNERIWILDHESGQILSSFGRTGHQAGEFTFVHTAAVDSKGNIIAGETVGGRRVQKFKLIGIENVTEAELYNPPRLAERRKNYPE